MRRSRENALYQPNASQLCGGCHCNRHERWAWAKVAKEEDGRRKRRAVEGWQTVCTGLARNSWHSAVLEAPCSSVEVCGASLDMLVISRMALLSPQLAPSPTQLLTAHHLLATHPSFPLLSPCHLPATYPAISPPSPRQTAAHSRNCGADQFMVVRSCLYMFA